MRKLKILLITPETFDKAEGYTKEDIAFIGFPSLSAAVIGALTPDFADFEAIDEAVDPLQTPEAFDQVDADIVAISLNMSYKAKRAVRIASEFKRRGKIVVWGGVHVTSLFDYHRERFDVEVAPYADAVVLGEAEAVWAGVIEDICNGRLQKFYRASGQPAAALWPVPAYHSVNTRPFLVKHSRQATRGCPLDCEFCSVTSFNGPSFRKRNARLIADEIRAALTEIGSRKLDALTHATSSFFAFVDDNIGFDRQYFAELLMELIEVKREFPKFAWGGQTTLYTIDKKVRYKGIEYSLADLMRKSGCIAMFIGVESVSKESLAIANKNFNDVDKYPDQIKRFHDHGMMLNAGMVMGFDSDTPSVFEDTYQFLVKNRIEISLLNILVPLAGTDLYRRYAADGRIFDHDWENYDGRHVVYYPSRMTPEQLEGGFLNLWKELYSLGAIAKRILHPSQVLSAIKGLPKLTKLEQIGSRLFMNWRYAKISTRIRKAREKASPERFGENVTFADMLLRRNERATIFLKGQKPAVRADERSPLVQLTLT
ncbi:MAG: B12-binding domain-containing radical SAM protein [Nitrospirae bacterium]|nr:B12-binding domain-containing radical SAM protein [Nitrospirota bacterium]